MTPPTPERGDPDEFGVAVEDRERHRLAFVRGEVDAATTGRLVAALEEHLEPGAPAMVVDLYDVGFVDSVGIGALIRVWKRCLAAGVPFALVVGEGAPLRTLRLAEVPAIIAVHPTLGGALTELGLA